MTDKRIRNTRAEFNAALHAAEHGWRKELRGLIADLPDPKEYAYRMPSDLAEALLCAMRGEAGCYYLPREIGRHLRDYGLCDYHTYGLTAFGFAVWKVLKEADDA